MRGQARGAKNWGKEIRNAGLNAVNDRPGEAGEFLHIESRSQSFPLEWKPYKHQLIIA